MSKHISLSPVSHLLIASGLTLGAQPDDPCAAFQKDLQGTFSKQPKNNESD